MTLFIRGITLLLGLLGCNNTYSMYYEKYVPEVKVTPILVSPSSPSLKVETSTLEIVDNQWFIYYPELQKKVDIPDAQIQHIMASVPPDILAQALVGNRESLKDYIFQNGFLIGLSSDNKNTSQGSSGGSAFMGKVFEKSKQSHHMPSTKKLVMDNVIQHMYALQLQGNKSRLIEIIKQLEREKPFFASKQRRMTKQINRGKELLQEPLMQIMFAIRSGPLHEAEAALKQLQSRPYNVKHIFMKESELTLAQKLFAQRRDYHIKLAEKIYAGEKVTEYESQLAQKASQYPEYQEKLQQRELRIEHLKNHSDELPIYKEFLSNNPVELKHIPIDGNILSVEQFRQWCEQKTAQQELIKELSCGVQPHVIQILQSTHDNTIVAQKLDVTINAVLAHAYANNYLVTPEVDWRLQAALKALPKSVDPKDFTFHMATIEHLLNDIQMQTVLTTHEQPKLIERSPQLLAQAVTKYFEYLAPTEGELSFIADLARYVSDVTVGTEYLSAEVRTQRIETFWNTVNNISFKNLSNLSAEQVIDGAVYVAARATYACGVPAAISMIKDVMEGIRTASFFAERFKKGFDQVIHDNPIIIADEGTVVWNASQDAVAEARQIIQAFDGMKDNPSGKKPEILDDAQKVMEKEKEIESNKAIVRGTTKKPPKFAPDILNDAVSITMKQKGNHIFANKLHPKPYLDQLANQVGGRQKLIRDILEAGNGKFPVEGFFEFSVTISDEALTVRGFVNNGKPIINTVFK